MPTATLFYCPVLTSVIVSSMIQLAFQLFYFINIREQPFYVALDPENLSFDSPNDSYECTILFMIANFQYLITCMAFSIAKPFRKPIWTNIPFTIFVIVLFLVNALFVFMPSSSKLSDMFNLLTFETPDGTEHYSYRYLIAIGILANAVITYAAEKFIINVVTVKADKRLKDKKEDAFEAQMDHFKAQALKQK